MAIQRYLCSLARDSEGFVVCGKNGQDVRNARSEGAARREAERRWPGATFALTTMRDVWPNQEQGAAGDIVVMAVLGAGSPVKDGAGHDHPVLGFIMGAAHGPQCISFTKEVFPDAKNGIGAGVWN